MKYAAKYFNAEGVIPLATKQGAPVKAKDVAKKNEEIEICLKCTRKKCNGYCKKFRTRHSSGGS